MQLGQAILQKWDARTARIYPRMEITGEGLTLGAGTALAKMGQDGPRGIKLTVDERRVAALLATACGRPIGPRVLAKIERACEFWNAGEKALAHIHLAEMGLPPCSEDETLRLFVAEELLENDVSPDMLLKGQGFEFPAPRLFKWPGQPRIP